MSLKDFGNLINQINTVKKEGSSKWNTTDSKNYKNLLESFMGSSLDADGMAKKLNKAGASKDFIDTFLNDVGNSNKFENISKDDAYKARQKYKQNASKNSLDISGLSEASSEAQATKKGLSDLGQVNLDNVNSSASKLGETFRTGVTNGVEKAKSGIKSLGSSIKSVLSGLSATLKSYLPLLAVLAAFEGIKAIHSNIQSQRKDELNAGQKNLDKYNKKIDKNNDNVKQAKKLQEEFNTLSSGVDSNTNENIGLSTSQYERYLAIKKELVKLNGDLVTGHNSEGEALINNNTAIQDTIDKYQKLADQSKKDIASKKNVNIQNDSIALKAQKSLYGSTFTDESLGANLKRSLPYTFRSAKNLAKDGLSMNEASVRQSLYSNADFQKQAAKILGKDKIDVSKLTSKQIQELANNSDTFNSEGFIGKNDTKNLKKLLAASKTNYDQLQKYSDSFRKNTLSNISQAVDGYDKLDKTTKTFASNFISNMDIDPSKMLDTDYLDKQEKTVENLTKKLTQNKDVQDQIKDFQKTQANGKMNANKWQQNVNDQFTALQKSTGIDKDTLALTLGIKLDDKDNVLSSTGKDIAKMQETLNDTFKNQDISKFTDYLNLNDLSNAFDIVTDKTNIFTGSVDQLKERLKMLNSSAASASYTVEGYKAALGTDDDDSAYNTLVSGMKQTKEEYDQGKVGTDQFKTFAGMMSPTGKTDAKNFKENYDNLKKYFTEDNSGVYTFFDDLKTKTNDSGKALADFDKKTQKWKINIDSTASAAKKFGMGVEPFEALLNNLKTYGFDVNFSSLTEQYNEASEALDKWSEAWDKNGGVNGDSQGQEIENYRQQLIKFKNAGKEIPDNWVKIFTIKINVAKAQSELDDAISLYKNNKKENGKGWKNTKEAKSQRKTIISKQEAVNAKINSASESALKSSGRDLTAEAEKKLDELDKKVQKAKQSFNKDNSDSNYKSYVKASETRNKYQTKVSSDSNKYTIKTDFSSLKEAKNELGRLGKEVGKKNTIKLSADDKDARKVVNSWNKKAPKNKKIKIIAQDEASKKIDSVNNKKVKDKKTKISANDKASATIAAIKAYLKSLKDKSITITTTQRNITENIVKKITQNGSPKFSGKKGGKGSGIGISTMFLNGTAHASGTVRNKLIPYSKAFAQGTVSDLTDFTDWDDESQSFAHGTVRKLSARALAIGDWGAKDSGSSLVGELGAEIRIPAGTNRWELLGANGAEFRKVNRGDIIFNHKQTESILKHGHINSRAKVYGTSAFAHGTAFASGHRVTGSGAFQGGAASGYKKHSSGSSSTKKHTESTKKNTEATKKNTDSKKKDSKATDKSTKKKSKFAILLDNMGKQFDFIAIAIDRAATATEKFANMINDYVKPEVKQSALWNQYKSTGKEISVNQQAASKYKSEASSFASKAIKTVPKTKNSSKKKNQKRLRTYFERVRNGSMNINTIKNDNMRSAVESYQNLYEKYLQANSAAQQLKNTQRDLFNQWLNMPTEKAQKAIENLQNSYDTLSNRSSAASTGESGVARLVQTSNDRLSEAQSNVSSAKSTQSRASSANKTAQKKVSKATKSQKSKAKSATKAVNKSGLSKKKKASLNKSIKAGKTISTKGLKGSAKKKVTAYNKAVKSTKSAKSSAAKTSANLSSANSALYDAQVYLDNVTKEQAIASNYAGQPAYTYQNDVLKNQVDNKKEQYENSQTAVREASKNQAKYQKESENAQANKNKADSAVKTKGSSILSGKKAKKLSNSQKNAIKSGKEVSLKGIKDKTLLKQLKAYNEQVKKAKDASNKLAQAKQNEADATNALATANKNANDAAADWAAEQTNAAVQSQANIKAYYDAKQNYESQHGTNAESAANNKQAHGQDLQVSDYQAQIDSKQRNKQLAIEKKAKLQDNLNQKLNDGSIKQGSQEWLQMQTEIDACNSEINDLDTGIENLKDTMRDDVFYRGFERALEASKHLQNSIETINSLISDEDMMFDMDGNITDYGVTAIATNIADYNKYKDDIKTYLGEIDQIESDWRNGNIKSEEEYKKKKREAEEGITTSMKGMQSAQKANVEILKSNAKLRIDAINKTIDAYKNCLQKTKDYYSYDKQLKSSNKEIQILESKRRALEGVNTAEAKAQKARLDAELQEKKDARDDTVKDHIYSLQIDGLEELSTKLNDDYEKYAHELSSSVENIKDLFDKLTNVVGNDTETVVNTVDKVLKTLYGVTADQIGLKKSDYTVTSDQQSEAQKSIQESMLKNMMSVMTPEAANSLATQLLSNLQEVSDTQMSEQQQEIAKKILEALNTNTASITGYAKGGLVKSVHKNGDDGLAALAVGEEVATVDVVNLANKIRQDKVLNALANGHTLNGMTMDGIGTTEINVNFGEAIGAINVPSGVSDEELQRIVNESYKYTSQKVTRDMAKIVGRKCPV